MAPVRNGILAVGLLAASPARVAEDVDVGRPEDEALVEVALVARDPAVVHRAGLVGDAGRDAQHEVGVPRRREADGLREHRRPSGAGDAVQRLVPPRELRDAQPIDGRGALDHQRHLLVKREPPDEVVDTRVDREIGVAERHRHGRLREGPAWDHQAGQNREQANGRAELKRRARQSGHVGPPTRDVTGWRCGASNGCRPGAFPVLGLRCSVHPTTGRR